MFSFRSVARMFSSLAIKTSFWGAVAYYGPATVATTAVGTIGLVPAVATFAFINLGGVELVTFLLI